jgi:hypothetical protein
VNSGEVRTGLYVLPQVASNSQLTVSRLPRQCGILNISQPYRPPRPVTRIVYFFFFTFLHCLDNLLTGGGKVVSPMLRQRFTPQKHYLSASSNHFC